MDDFLWYCQTAGAVGNRLILHDAAAASCGCAVQNRASKQGAATFAGQSVFNSISDIRRNSSAVFPDHRSFDRPCAYADDDFAYSRAAPPGVWQWIVCWHGGNAIAGWSFGFCNLPSSDGTENAKAKEQLIQPRLTEAFRR